MSVVQVSKLHTPAGSCGSCLVVVYYLIGRDSGTGQGRLFIYVNQCVMHYVEAAGVSGQKFAFNDMNNCTKNKVSTTNNIPYDQKVYILDHVLANRF